MSYTKEAKVAGAKTKEVLNQLVADLSQFSVIIHQTHWYMRGNDFLTLHPQMDTFMDGINDQLDEVAERLITIGGAPYSTLSEFAEQTKLSDEPGSYDKTISERMERLVDGYRYLSALYAEGIEAAGEEGDNVTEDMFINFKGIVEKQIWMLTAKLGREPGL
ncbi:Dps family protein [uncultured Vagococcus sp.]|uniref:Dps family protein n=1 Tax=uncultured Vagococcus sp. TaxID=189676 RepID=UPI0028D3BF02|nr:Dps family protein [uncultured Vagococcus sp.]